MNKIVRFAYYWTYLNILIFSICIFIWLLGLEINYPKNWAGTTTFTIIFDYIFLSIFPLISLSMRDNFDLLRMEDGKSIISQWIWVMLSLSVNAVAALAQYAGVSEYIEYNNYWSQ